MAVHRPFNLRKHWVIIGLALAVSIFLAACSSPPETPVQCPEVECPELSCPDPISYEELWTSSGHADSKAEAFTHWDQDDPQEVPTDCAKCHSRPGFIDFLGVDGTTAGRVDNAAQIGTTITCYVCHNEQTMVIDHVVFPSGAMISDLDTSAICMQCHQGRESTISVNEATQGLDDDAISDSLTFRNVHYFAAGATILGTEVKGAYEYSGKSYNGRYLRAGELFTCIRCHDQHSLEVDYELCAECHTSKTVDFKDVRVDTTDFDGDGNIDEGITYEIQTIYEALYVAIQSYSRNVIGLSIVYEPATYPYYFIDENENGIVDEGETREDNVYNSWSPRLLRAAYNYQYVTKDPGAYAHNADYIVQILYDSLADIGGDVTGMLRPDSSGK